MAPSPKHIGLHMYLYKIIKMLQPNTKHETYRYTLYKYW